ncbi:MAG TPA: carbohydrate kinase family protein [Thermomicrobiales bacterium]|nr:carbohydrate kinase family protein [Thermomicrobiales bacterium]
MRRGVAAIGLCSWDRFVVTDDYPGPGEYAVVRHQLEQAGGTTGNTCHALAKVGVNVLLVSVVGDDPEGAALIDSLRDAGCDTGAIAIREGARSDTGIIIVSGPPSQRDRTIYWIQGVKPLMGDPLPVDEMLEHEWVHIDIDDPRLRSFFLDLPAHRSPRTKLFGTMTYLVEMPPGAGWQHALRFDAVTGNERELRTLLGAESLDAAIDQVQRDLVASACQVVFLSRGPYGAIAIRESGVELAPAVAIEVIDTTGAGDAFAAGCLWGLLDRLDDADILRRANALGGLACRALGARAGLPTRAEVERVLSGHELPG